MRLWGAVAAAFVVLSACATPLPPPAATFDNVRSIRAAGIPPLALGEFSRGPALPEARDRSIAIRADALQPPGGGTFSSYLRSTIEAELAGAGLLDGNSRYVLGAQLTQSEVSTFGSESRGRLAAMFRLSDGQAVVFEKELMVEDAWPSAFLGAIAIPEAMNHYTGLYPRLFAALLEDPEFRAALAHSR